MNKDHSICQSVCGWSELIRSSSWNHNGDALMGRDFENEGGSLIGVWVRFNLSYRFYGSHLLVCGMVFSSGE
jgi:hypothetical protein